MQSCCWSIESLSAYVDQELSQEEAQALCLHAESCPQCSKHIASLKALKHHVSQLDGTSLPSDRVKARITALQFRPPSRRVPRWAWAMAATFVLCVAAYRALKFHADTSLSEELISDHIKYLHVSTPAQLASNDPTEMAKFFAGQVPFAPVVPRLPDGQLVGGRTCRIKGRLVQLLFYEKAGRKLSLYVSDELGTLKRCRSKDGMCVCGKRRNDISLLVVGDTPEKELIEVLDSVRL